MQKIMEKMLLEQNFQTNRLTLPSQSVSRKPALFQCGCVFCLFLLVVEFSKISLIFQFPAILMHIKVKID